MRIAYLVSRYPAVSHVFLRREVAALRARGIDVTTVTVRRSTDLLDPADVAEDAGTLALVPARPWVLVRAHARALARPVAYGRTLADAARAGRRQLLYFGEAILLWDLLRRRGLRHVHVHFANNASDIALLAVAYGRRAGAGPSSWSLTVHGASDLRHPERNRLALKAADASGVLCVSDFTRAQLLAAVPVAAAGKLRVARYGVTPPAVEAASLAAPAAGPLRVLCVGRMTPVKGHTLLVEAVRLLVARGVAVELTLVGDGPLRGELEALARGLPVTFTGALGEGAVAARYAVADVFCLSSVYEGLPVVLMEAMSHGLPVVAPWITAVPELVRDEVDGLLVPPGRPDALADAVARLAGDPALRARLGASARARMGDGWSAERSGDTIAAALREVVPA